MKVSHGGDTGMGLNPEVVSTISYSIKHCESTRCLETLSENVNLIIFTCLPTSNGLIII